MIHFDQVKKDDISFEGEAVRLSNELRAKPFHTYIDRWGKRIDTPAKQGFNCETCDFMTMVNWLADTRIKKSDSLICFIHRLLSVRFPNEYAQQKDNIEIRFKIEYEMIQANSKNDIAWLGEVGFQNMVRCDDSLTNSGVNIVKNRDGSIEIK